MPGQKEAADSHGDARVAQCDHPVTGQSLHLLVVGVGETEKDKVTDRVRTLLEARAVKGGPGLAAFEEVRVTTLPPYFTRDGLSARLRSISREIQKQIKAGRPNHVVMIYYHGIQSLTS